MGGMGYPRKRPNPDEDEKETAAKTLQAFWSRLRFNSTKRIVKQFIETGLNKEKMSIMK